MSKILATCLDCGTPIGERAATLNAIPHCGWSALGCAHFHGGGAADLLHDNLNNCERAALAGVVTDTSFRILLADDGRH